MSRTGRSGRALQRERFLADRRAGADPEALRAALADRLARTGPGPAPLGAASSDTDRWVPIGPSVLRRGLADDRPRVTGRVRDLAVSPDGRRVYAATAKGGAWWSGDAGGTWAPLGGSVDRPRDTAGGANAQSCGCLLVHFDPGGAEHDVVLVGTGEPWPHTRPFGGRHGGVGVLAATGPAAADPDADPWEATTGRSVLEGQGIWRMARSPASVPGRADGPARDVVLAGTTVGLFRGTRGLLADLDPDPDPSAPGPAGTGYAWEAVAGYDAFVTVPGKAVHRMCTDLLWLPGGRVVAAVYDRGVAVSDDDGDTWHWVGDLAGSGALHGRMSLAALDDEVLVLGERARRRAAKSGQPHLWRFPATAATTGSPSPLRARAVRGLPSDLWGTQRDYDQALAADRPAPGARPRVWVGGSTARATASSVWHASLWAFELDGDRLVPAPGLSTAADGADREGLVGNDVHADVHALRLSGPADRRALWVACDGGVFASADAGRVNGFSSRAVGLAVLEPGFLALHPSASGVVAAGTQDNGSAVRSGDTVWDTVHDADAGGVVLHPLQPQLLLAQYTGASWRAEPAGGFVDPVTRTPGRPSGGVGTSREGKAALFYSGAAARTVTAEVEGAPRTWVRLALGTNRTWLSDDWTATGACTWRVLPSPGRRGRARTAEAADARPRGKDSAARRGVPPGALGGVVTVRWASDTELLVLHERGLVRHVQDGAATGTRWTSTRVLTRAGAGLPEGVVLTDVLPAEAGACFLLTSGDETDDTVDTCYRVDLATGALAPTGLRRELDTPPPLVFPGPRDPAFSAVLDPAAADVLLVGTAGGLWRGVRQADGSYAWDPFANGLPHATVQDLAVAGTGEGRLLRAAVQSRGVWEVALGTAEPPRTWARVHAWDDRRVLPTPLAPPRLPPGSADLPPWASPDVVVRPASPPAAAPAWQLGAGTIRAGSAPPYELWTFQTAFRWLHPAVEATGVWSDAFGDLVAAHRGSAADPALRAVDEALWDAVVGRVRVTPDGTVTQADSGPLGVYRPGWQTPTSPAAGATEVDLLELVQPVGDVGGVWTVYREPSVVDVLLHHRDTRPLPPGTAWAVLLSAHGPTQADVLSRPVAGVREWAEAVGAGGTAAPPAGWQVHGRQVLGLPLEARLPRAVSFAVDLGAVPAASSAVLLLAVVGSGPAPTAHVEPARVAPVAVAPSTGSPVSDLVLGWPYAAARLLALQPRP